MVQNEIMSQGRPIEFDPNLALTKAMEVFWCKGYEAISLVDLLDAMGISKSSFYQAFRSKHEIFERCLQMFRLRQVELMTGALQKAPSGRAFLRSMLRSAAHETTTAVPPKGCLIMNTASEFSGRDPVISKLVEDGTKCFAKVFQAAIERAQSEGEVDQSKNSQILARFMVTTMSGLKTMAKAGMPGSAIEDVADAALAVFD